MELLQAALAILRLELLIILLEVVMVVVVVALKIVRMAVMEAVRIYTHITVWLLTNITYYIKHSR